MALTSPRFFNDFRLQAASENRPPIYPGTSGEAVATVQQAFIDLGYVMPKSVKKDGTTDGIFGNETVRIVKQFESDESLKQDQGVIGREVMGRLDEKFGTNSPGALPVIRGFKQLQATTVRADVARAVLFTNTAANVLVPDLAGNLDPEVVSLLEDCFATDCSDPDDRNLVQRIFRNFQMRIMATTLTHTTRHAPDKQHLGYDAFVDHNLNPAVQPAEIFIVEPYFNKGSPDRAGILIHEYIHLLTLGPDHPGLPDSGDAAFFGRGKMGVPYSESLSNAYCYEKFAVWLQDVLPKLGAGPANVPGSRPILTGDLPF